MMGDVELNNFLRYGGINVYEPSKQMLTMCRDANVTESVAPARLKQFIASSDVGQH